MECSVVATSAGAAAGGVRYTFVVVVVDDPPHPENTVEVELITVQCSK